MNPQTIEGQPPALNDPLGFGIPDHLVFDDHPLEALLYETSPIAPTPASVLELWDQGRDRSDACACAVASVLLQSPDSIGQFRDLDSAEQSLRQAIDSQPPKRGAALIACWSGLGRIQELKNQNREAEASYRQAFELQKGDPNARPEQTDQIVSQLIQLLDKSNRHEEADQIHNRHKADCLRDREDEGSLMQLRVVALNMFLAGQYAESEAVYRRLLEKRFEPPSTHCHLARVFLRTDRDADARREVEQAWAAQSAPPTYLLVRIQFLRTLLQILAGEEWKARLVEFKHALSEPGAHMEWTMQPVLDHLKPRLGPEQFELLTAMLAAVSKSSKLSELKANPMWRECCHSDGADVSAAMLLPLA